MYFRHKRNIINIWNLFSFSTSIESHVCAQFIEILVWGKTTGEVAFSSPITFAEILYQIQTQWKEGIELKLFSFTTFSLHLIRVAFRVEWLVLLKWNYTELPRWHHVRNFLVLTNDSWKTCVIINEVTHTDPRQVHGLSI